MCRLMNDQAEVLRVVKTGHNAFITGQVGTGKSHLVKKIFRCLTSQRKKVAIVRASGIAGTVYADLNTSIVTVQSFYGLKTAELPWNLVVDRATSNNLVCERIKDVDCVLWDEASMSSRRFFDLANRIHLTLSPERESRRPFSGKQVIVVGEFLQLRPVPNFLDEGKYLFTLPVFDRVLTHRYELTTLVRQDADADGVFTVSN